MVELREQPAGLLCAPVEKIRGVRVQVALDEERPDGFSQQIWAASVPLNKQNKRF